MAAIGSTLDVTCEQYVDRILIVEPHHGLGWFHEKGSPFPEDHVPPPFRLKVVRFYSYNGERRGLLARIGEPGFGYDGFWLVSMTRHLGIWDFTNRPAIYNLLICPEEPLEGRPEDSPQFATMWPIWHMSGHPHASGFGRIAETLQCCSDYERRTNVVVTNPQNAEGIN